MANLQWLLDLLLSGLLAATLFQAMRLERSLAALKRDRAALDDVLASFGASTRDADAGITRLRQLTETAGRQMTQQAERGLTLKDELAFLTDRADRLADRLESLIRLARPIAAEPPRAPPPDTPAPHTNRPPGDPDARVRSQAERDLINALRMTK